VVNVFFINQDCFNRHTAIAHTAQVAPPRAACR
jgi:hypothetical protein